MSDFDEKLGAILGDQEAMGQIMALAQSLSMPKPREDDAVPEVGCETPGCPDTRGQDVQLLAALRPYLKDSRRKKLDKALELLQVIRLLKAGGE